MNQKLFCFRRRVGKTNAEQYMVIRDILRD